MKEELHQEAIHDQNRRLLGRLNHEYGLTSFSAFSAGELNTSLFRCQTESAEKRIVKIGTGNDLQKKEVLNNIKGYKAIQSLGAGGILPRELQLLEFNDTPVIIMSDLGDDFGDQVKSGDLRAYDTFLSSMPHIYESSLHETKDGQIKGLEVTRGLLMKWFGELYTRNVVSDETMTKISEIEISRLSGPRSTLMLMDFTPNNVFTNDGKVSFIDPWDQDTYLGTPIPSIGQFITLSHDVHNYPGAAENRDHFETLAKEWGGKLGLTDEQIEKQFSMGAALQLSLSAFVRIGGEQDERGRRYALQAEKQIQDL